MHSHQLAEPSNYVPVVDLASPPDAVAPPTSPQAVNREAILDALRAACRGFLRKTSFTDDSIITDLTTQTRHLILIVRKVHKQTGIEIPFGLFFQHLSIAQIADCVAGVTSCKLDALWRIREGKDSPALIMIPGMGGASQELYDLARSLQYDGSIYVATYPGLIGNQQRAITVKAVSDLFYDELRQRFPGRPVILFGYSIGGAIALEMAERLTKDGLVPLVALFEPGLVSKNWRLRSWLGWLTRGVRKVANAPRHLPGEAPEPGASPSAPVAWTGAGASQKVSNLLRRAYAIVGMRIGIPFGNRTVSLLPYHVTNLPSRLQAVRDGMMIAYTSYRPSTYRGNTVLFCSERGEPMMCAYPDAWRRYLPTAKFIEVPGDHMSGITNPHAAVVAKELDAFLQQWRHR